MTGTTHATHLYAPDRAHAKLVARALLQSPHALVFTPPYGPWMNVYLPLGMSVQNLPEVPTTPALELNSYGEEGFEVILFSQDRLAFKFESGLDDAGEEEAKLLEMAVDLYERETGDVLKTPLPENPEEEPGDFDQTGYFSRDAATQETFRQRARDSGEYQDYLTEHRAPQTLPDLTPLLPLLPKERSEEELFLLFSAAGQRRTLPEGPEKECVRKWAGTADGLEAGDWVRAVGNFFGLKGSLLSLEGILAEHGDAVDGRIFRLDGIA